MNLRSIVAVTLLTSSAAAGAQLSPSAQQQIAAKVNQILQDTGVPSASVGIALDDKIVYTQAFGLAHLHPDVAARPDMAYPIGSVSKQFTATAMLLLQQDGRLSIDDKVAKYFPELTRANEISIRNLLTMTSGYEDYAPQDYIIPAWLHEKDPLTLIHEWAEKPLDFEPGTQWQYSNTNYVLCALIIQKVTGEPLMTVLRERVFKPLHLEGVVNTYTEREKLQVTGYVSNAMAAVREQPLEANGWYIGDGDLAMPASTLLQWDLSIANQTLLSPASYKEFETSFVLKDGTDAHYGLGIDINLRNGHRLLSHSGEVGGFVSQNALFPEDKFAVVVLTNEVASSAASKIAGAVTKIALPGVVPPPPPADNFAALLQAVMAGLQHSQIDRSLLTADCNSYFDKDTLADFQSTLAPLGTVKSATRTRTQLRGGMTFGLYRVEFSGGEAVLVSVYLEPDGKIEQLLVEGKA